MTEQIAFNLGMQIIIAFCGFMAGWHMREALRKEK
jgi:hypothetical protein